MSERIETINQQLIDCYGIDTITGLPIWRVVWSDDQYEKRLTDYDSNGIALMRPEVRLLPKYKQWLPSRWVLERLVIVPEVNAEELPTSKLSYEPIFPFEDKGGKPIPPKYNVASFVIDTVYAAMGKKSMAKYVDPDIGLSTEEQLEKRNGEIQDIQNELFGNETDVGDALAHGEAIIVPRNYRKEN
jgi:hypothetical protein